MKRALLLLLVIAGLITPDAFGRKKEARVVSNFTGIDASGVFDITVSKGSRESLVVEADEKILPYIRSEVRKGVLHLYLSNDRKLKNIKTLKASVVMKNLDKVTLSGTCKLTTTDLFTPKKFKGDCSGASNMTINLHTGQLNIETSGVCNIRLKANVTGDTKLDMSGTSGIRGELKANNVKLNISGAGSIELTGSATDFKMDVSGASKVKAADFTVKNVTVESSGAAQVSVHATDRLKVNSSGAASVSYKGSPAFDINVSRATKIKKI